MNDTAPATPQTVTTTTTTTTESAEATLTRLIASKPFMVALQLFAVMGGLVGAMFLYVANGAVKDLADVKTSVAALQLSLTPQISEIKTEIANIKNQATLDRADINRLQDHMMAPTVLVTPTHGGKTR